MIIAPTQQGNVIIDIPDWNIRKNRSIVNVGVRISGGADSAIVAYMLALYVKECKPHLKLYPITCENPKKPYQIIFAKKVISKIEELTNVKFCNHYTHIIPGLGDYADEQYTFLQELYSKELIDCHFMGETLNPPADELEKWVDQKLPKERNFLAPVADINGGWFRPLRHSHKRSVYDLYNYYNVLETLFPVTRSCEALTTDFTKHCEMCAFCKERYWGFNRFI